MTGKPQEAAPPRVTGVAAVEAHCSVQTCHIKFGSYPSAKWSVVVESDRCKKNKKQLAVNEIVNSSCSFPLKTASYPYCSAII